MISLPDVNVLIALAWNNHPQHDSAHKWFSGILIDGWATCILTQTAFLRLSMNPRIVGVSIDCQSAVHLLQKLVAHPQHHYADVAPPMTDSPIDELTPKVRGYRQISDATLLHLARHHGMKLVTFDQPLAALSPWTENLEVLIP